MIATFDKSDFSKVHDCQQAACRQAIRPGLRPRETERPRWARDVCFCVLPKYGMACGFQGRGQPAIPRGERPKAPPGKHQAEPTADERAVPLS